MPYSRNSFGMHKLLDQGASVSPLQSVSPPVLYYSEYAEKTPKHDEMNKWVLEGQQAYGLVVGIGNFHVLKFDADEFIRKHYERYVTEFLEDISIEVLKSLVIQTTDLGFQIIYRCISIMIADRSVQPICYSVPLKSIALINAPGYKVVSGSLAKVGEISESLHENLLNYATEFSETFIYTMGLGL